MKKQIVALLAGAMLMVGVGTASADSIFYLNSISDNINNTGTLGPWAQVTLSDSTIDDKDSVHFSIDPIDDAFINRGDNFGLQTFYFNVSTDFGASLRIGNFNQTDWSCEYSNLSYNAGGGFGKFDFITEGDGNTRANPLSFDVYEASGNAVSIADFSTSLSAEGFLFAAHIADYNGGLSAKFATDGTAPVPEPGTMMLFGIGMLGLAVYGKRRMNKEA